MTTTPIHFCTDKKKKSVLTILCETNDLFYPFHLCLSFSYDVGLYNIMFWMLQVSIEKLYKRGKYMIIMIVRHIHTYIAKCKRGKKYRHKYKFEWK